MKNVNNLILNLSALSHIEENIERVSNVQPSIYHPFNE